MSQHRTVSSRTVPIRAAHPAEAGRLSTLALRSKGLWGYDEQFLAACRRELTVPPEVCAAEVRVATAAGAGSDGVEGAGSLPETETGDGALAGFRWLRPPDEGVAVLEMLYVAPELARRGIGAALLADALAVAAEGGAAAVELDADPHAKAFYRAHGARCVGRVASGSIPGRTLPRLRIDLP